MALNNNDLFLVNQGGESKKITYANLKSNLNEDEALWELDGTNIQPKNDSHNVEIGGGAIKLNADGIAEVDSTVAKAEICKNNGLFLWRKNDSVTSEGIANFLSNVGGIGVSKCRIFEDGSATFSGGDLVIDSNNHIRQFGQAGSGGSTQLSIAAAQPGNGGRSLISASVGATAINTGTTVFRLLDNGDLQLSDTAGSQNTTINSTGWAVFGAGGDQKINAGGIARLTSNVDCGVAFISSTDGRGVVPCSGALSPLNNVINLGSTTSRWNNIYGSVIRSSDVFLETESDDPANYTVEGEYTGPTLNVRERIMNLISRLDAIEANEVIDDATDTSLLQLVANASARLDSIEARLAALEGGN